MTEKDLIDNGFEFVNFPDSQSNNGFDYYFYIKTIVEGLTLISTDSILVENDNWTVTSWDIIAINISNVEYLKLLETAIKKVTNV